jgi:hypothetical protein
MLKTAMRADGSTSSPKIEEIKKLLETMRHGEAMAHV